jgi:hypothetical protein
VQPLAELQFHHGAPDALGHVVRAVLVRVRQQDAELLAAVAAHHVHLAQAAAHDTGHHLQHLVAHLVAVGVVVHLEMVDVHHHHRQGHLLPAAADDLLLETLHPVVAVA